MTLIQLHYFQTVCKYNNLTKAAHELHISQPSLSNAMKELEKEFGLTLFYRHSKGLSLTEEGEQFLREAGQLLEQEERFLRRMHELGDAKQPVRLGVPPMLSALIFPRLFQASREHCPEIHLQLVENGTISNKELVLEGNLDAAIVSSDAPLPAAFGSYEMCSADIFFYLSATHPLASRKEIDLSEVEDVPLALLAEDSFLTSFLKQNFRDRDLTLNVMLNTNQLAAIWQLVENNAAATFLFDQLLPADQNIVKIPVKGLPRIQIQLVWNRKQRMSGGLKKLIHLAGQVYPGSGDARQE
ncbi:MAG TPA: LysR family transcriptional regulator [Candidatus Blautia gallistercoris]|uniref:LysR family transcriptional regulator n=1 Tax=Candidatus Blautia gallistercoris TaxID=2838490 RepID=A0A9D2B3J5_9FIRM|nr:LysR family transcriptional regulator [Candidatus Blautia gallistercoris]